MAGLLTRERIVAPPGWSRWLVPPAALAIHLAIGQAYAWTAFKTALNGTLLAGNPNANVLSGLPFQLAILMLGISAAVFGTRVDSRGPRWAMTVATGFFVAGFLISALGLATGQYWLVVVGYGGIGGIGLGIGYISPVSTLIKWFPDRPGLSTGIAIMGFGGGALIATPLTNELVAAFSGGAKGAAGVPGLALTFLVMGLIYLVFMAVGPLLIRVPAEGWRPAGWTPPKPSSKALGSVNVTAANAIKTPQFWLLWIVLCFNVTAGIGVLERAQSIWDEFFLPTGVAAAAATAAAGGFAALLSLANSAGRIGWSSLSDVLGRKNMYRIYLAVGAVLYLLLLLFTNGSRVLFVVAAVLILSFYGAGFATVPAYLRDLFGTYEVGAIHGRLLTAWSVAGVAGPLIVNAIADSQKGAGVTGPGLTTPAFIIMIVLLVIGFVANELIRPVASKFHMRPPKKKNGVKGTRTREARA